MRIVVTGGAGFIGSHVAEALRASGHEVVVLDNLSTGSRENLEGVEVEWVIGDLREPDDVRRALSGAHAVVHLAGFVSVPGSIADPITSHEINVRGTEIVLDECRRGDVGRVIFASSAAVYGDTETVPIPESLLLHPLSPYGEQKATGEALLRTAVTDTLDTLSFRFFNVYGPRQSPTSDYAAVIPIFRDRCLRGIAPRIYGDGSQTRDFIHVSDVAEGIQRALVAPQRFEGDAFNLARGESTSIEALARAIASSCDFAGDPEFAPPREGDIEHSVAEITRLREVFAWTPPTDLATGLQSWE